MFKDTQTKVQISWRVELQSTLPDSQIGVGRLVEPLKIGDVQGRGYTAVNSIMNHAKITAKRFYEASPNGRFIIGLPTLNSL